MSVGVLIKQQRDLLNLTLEEIADQMMAVMNRDTLTRHDVWRWQEDEVTPRYWLPALAQVLRSTSKCSGPRPGDSEPDKQPQPATPKSLAELTQTTPTQ
ncbi:hypothetical protein [Catenulispora rubra]|uniref:hypothetical protein n=1 Tax=Catenulispora rubra TaxID=280293 RepID=UPI00189253FB|nr:hypothetical protein [Catenulispora rubra]